MEVNYKHSYGDSIFGNSITGYSGQLRKKKQKRKNGLLLNTFEFKLSAVCFLNPPITSNPSKKLLSNFCLEGLKGYKIYGEAEKNSNFIKVNNTSGHTQVQVTLKGNSYCLITIPITSRR